MLWRDVIELVRVSETQNEYGEYTEDETTVQVFANKKSIRQTEFYQAMTAGLRPEIMFEVRAHEYSDEPKLKYNGFVYHIVRTYTKNDEITELVCSRYPMG